MVEQAPTSPSSAFSRSQSPPSRDDRPLSRSRPLPRRSNESESASTARASSTTCESPPPLTPIPLLFPGPELARLPDSFAHAVGWTRQCPRSAPLGPLARIQFHISDPLSWGADIQESIVNSFAVDWVCEVANARSGGAMVNAVGDQMANTWGPGAGAGPDAPLANTVGPSCWIESALQRHLLDLRLRAGLLKMVKVYKRKRDPISDHAGGDEDRVNDDNDNPGQAESPPPSPTSMSSLTTDHLSVVPATLSSVSQASQASAHAGLNKPDLVILGQTPATTAFATTTTSPNPPPVLTPTVVSLTCERKDHPSNAAEGFAQAIAYALTAASVYSTPFGLYWYQNRFVRIVVASEDLLVIESSASVRLDIRAAASAASSSNQDHQGQGRAVQLSDLLAVLTNRRAIDMCLHSLWDSDTGENDYQSVQTLWDLFMHCLALVLQHPTSCPRLARPAGWDPILAGLRFDQHAVEVWDPAHERERAWDELAFAAYRGQQARLRNATALRRAEMADNGDSSGTDSESHSHSDGDDGHPPDDADKENDNDNDNDHDDGDGDEDGGRGSGTDGGGSIDEDYGDRNSRQDADGSPSPSPGPGSSPGLDRATMDKVLEMKWGGREVYLDSLIAPIDPARPTAIDLLRLAHPSTRVMLVDPDVMDALVATSDRELQERLQARLAQVDGVDLPMARARGTGTGWADSHVDGDDHDHDHDHEDSNYARHTERALDPKAKPAQRTPGPISLPHTQSFST